MIGTPSGMIGTPSGMIGTPSGGPDRHAKRHDRHAKRHDRHAKRHARVVKRHTTANLTVLNSAMVATAKTSTKTSASTKRTKATGTKTTTTSTTPPTGASSGTLATVGLPSTAPSTTDPSGAAMPTGNLAGWNQVFSDDFADKSVPLGQLFGCSAGSTIMTSNCAGLPASVRSQLWAYPDGSTNTSGNGTYEPSQVLSIHDGMLDYDLHTTNGVHMVSAVEPKIPAASTETVSNTAHT